MIRGVPDISLGSAAVTSPIWLQYLESGSKTVALVGGAVLILIRVAIAIRDWRSGNNGKRD